MSDAGRGRLLEALLPRWDVREVHRTRVRASASATYAALLSADLTRLPLVRLLTTLRALPAALLQGRAGLLALHAPRAPLTLRALERRGFLLLGARPPHEVTLGIEGRFWRADGGVCDVTPAHFRGAPTPGTVRAVWDFTVRDAGVPGVVELATETRVRCADAAARRRFLPYWAVVRAGSGLIRRAMLCEVRRAAERGS